MKTKEKKLPKSQIEIEFELTSQEFEKHVKHALLLKMGSGLVFDV